MSERVVSGERRGGWGKVPLQIIKHITHTNSRARERGRGHRVRASASERQHAHSENAAKYDSSIQFLSCIPLKKLKLDGPVFCLVKIT